MPQAQLNKNYFLAICLLLGLLVILGWIFKIRLEAIKKNNLKNLATLNQALPNFNNQSIEQLKRQIRNSKIELLNLSLIFDPKEKWLKKDYDLSIYFVEELNKINELLKTKSVEKQVNVPALEFKEKLPPESEAFYLLSQLYGLKEVISLGTDYSVNFKIINPLGIEEVSGLPEIKLAKSSIELTCPAQALIEFILQLNEIIPKPCIASFSLKSQDSIFEMNLTLNHIVVNLDWKNKEELYASVELKEETSEAKQNFGRILRGKNPLFIPPAKETSLSSREQVQTALSKTESPKQPARFLYRGKATLRAKEVVVIEDTLNQETVFLGQGEKIDNFILSKFSSDLAVLKNVDNGQEIIIKREE